MLALSYNVILSGIYATHWEQWEKWGRSLLQCLLPSLHRLQATFEFGVLGIDVDQLKETLKRTSSEIILSKYARSSHSLPLRHFLIRYIIDILTGARYASARISDWFCEEIEIACDLPLAPWAGWCHPTTLPLLRPTRQTCLRGKTSCLMDPAHFE